MLTEITSAILGLFLHLYASLLAVYNTRFKSVSWKPTERNVVVSKLLIHPIKSCAGTSVSEARFTIEGLENDRKFIIMDAEKKKAVTARELPQMVLIKPTIVEDTVVISFPEDKGIPSFTVPLDPPESTLADWKHLEQVMVWSDACDGYIVQAIPNQEGVAVDPSEVLSGYLDRPVHLVLKGPSPRPVKPTDTHASLSTVTRFQDGYPLLVATMESLQSVEEQVRATAKGENDWNIGGLNTDRWSNSEVTIERFRPNIVLTGASAAFAEETWKEIQISDQGDGIIDMVSRCTRCLLPNVDPKTGIPDTAVPYKVISKYRRVEPSAAYSPCFGINACPRSSGIVRVGDKVKVLNTVERATLPIAPSKRQ